MQGKTLFFPSPKTRLVGGHLRGEADRFIDIFGSGSEAGRIWAGQPQPMSDSISTCQFMLLIFGEEKPR